MKKPVEIMRRELKDNSLYVKLHSYVVLMCEINGSEVKAARYDYYQSKYNSDLRNDIARDHPGWKVKGIYRLEEYDFEEKNHT